MENARGNHAGGDESAMTILKRRKREKFGIRQETRVRSYAHKKWVRGHECSIKGKHPCMGPIQSAHVRCGTDGAMGIVPSDCFTIPLCAVAHSMQHGLGEESFERAFGIDMKAIAAELWGRSPARLKMERDDG